MAMVVGALLIHTASSRANAAVPVRKTAPVKSLAAKSAAPCADQDRRIGGELVQLCALRAAAHDVTRLTSFERV